LTPAESAIVSAASFVKTLTSSVLEPVRTTMARFSGPVFSKVRMKPVDMARTEINTATTPAIPITTTEEVPILCGRLRRFMADTAEI
jgi:hypothetical protein